jgi:hypothetical protein
MHWLNISNRCNTRPLPKPLQRLLFIHKSRKVFFSGLKGQYNLAQGKIEGGTNRNVALGKEFKRKTVRENSINKVNNSLWTEL